MSALPELQDEPLPTTPETLLARFEALGIAYDLHHHRPIFTVEEGLDVDAEIPGMHCRTLFVRDKRERMALLSAVIETRLDLKKLPPLLGLDRISFGSPERMWRHLGVRPGSVCPFAAINDTEQKVAVFLDQAIFAGDRVNFHPLLNNRTVGMHPDDLKRFLESIGHIPHIVDLSSAAPEE